MVAFLFDLLILIPCIVNLQTIHQLDLLWEAIHGDKGTELIWGKETRTPVTPHYGVGLLVWMPNAQGHTQQTTSSFTDVR